MIRSLMNGEIELMQVVLGEGDVLVASGKSQVCGLEKKQVLIFAENPNGNEKVGDIHPELVGEKTSCIANTIVEVYFQTADDIKSLIVRLEEMLEHL